MGKQATAKTAQQGQARREKKGPFCARTQCGFCECAKMHVARARARKHALTAASAGGLCKHTQTVPLWTLRPKHGRCLFFRKGGTQNVEVEMIPLTLESILDGILDDEMSSSSSNGSFSPSDNPTTQGNNQASLSSSPSSSMIGLDSPGMLRDLNSILVNGQTISSSTSPTLNIAAAATGDQTSSSTVPLMVAEGMDLPSFTTIKSEEPDSCVSPVVSSLRLFYVLQCVLFKRLHFAQEAKAVAMSEIFWSDDSKNVWEVYVGQMTKLLQGFLKFSKFRQKKFS